MQIYAYTLVFGIVSTILLICSTKMIDWMVDKILKHIGSTIKSFIKINAYILLFVQLYLLYILIFNEQINFTLMYYKISEPIDIIYQKSKPIYQMIYWCIEYLIYKILNVIKQLKKINFDTEYLIINQDLPQNQILTQYLNNIKKIFSIIHGDFVHIFNND